MSRARDLSKLGNPNVIKADENSVGFGTQVAGNHANADSSLISAGIITATAFYGDGSNLEGVASAGLGTAVDDTKDSIGQNIYFTNAELSINENTTVNAPDTSSIAYTQYQQVTVESGSELIIADGDSFIPDVLGIGTALQASTAGAGNGLFGTVYADNIENVAGRGGPHFPLGITVAGVSTLSGNVSIGGTLTYEDVTNVDSIGLITARSGIRIGAPGTNTLISGTGSGIGIGTNSPLSELHVMQSKSGGSSHASSQLTLERDGTNYLQFMTANNGTSGLLFGDVADNDGTAIKYDHNTSLMLFNTEASERLRIGPAGQLGLSGANYGTSGQVLTSQGASAAPQWAAASGGIEEYDEWTVTANSSQTGWNNAVIGSNSNGATYGNTVAVARMTTTQNPLFAKIGTGMSIDVSTGVWTFPATGYWEVNFVPQIYTDGAGVHNWYVSATTDGGTTWKGGAEATGDGDGIYASNNKTSYGSGVYTFNIPVYMNITNTTNQKIRYVYSTTAGIYYKGSTVLPYTKWSFKKIA